MLPEQAGIPRSQFSFAISRFAATRNRHPGMRDAAVCSTHVSE
jgi:hypothetical protein